MGSAKKRRPATFIGTAAIFFAIINWIKVPAMRRWASSRPENMLTALALMPVAIASTFAGVALVGRVSADGGFYSPIYLLMIAVGGELIRKALFPG